MTLTISIRFLNGRAHLHHWQAHHSDGKVEWPPAPWRLLRALVAIAGRGLTTLPEPDFVCPVGKKPKATKKNPDPVWPPEDYVALPDNWYGVSEPPDEIPISRLTGLLSTLAAPPQIWLPKTSGGHTRQFFPIHEGGRVKPSGSAVFDTFAVIPKNQPIFFCWPKLDLYTEQLKDLSIILGRMTYFGRAESWCAAEVRATALRDIDDIVSGESHWSCICIEEHGKPSGREHQDYTLERKLVPLPPALGDGPGLPDETWALLPRTNPISSQRPKKQEDFVQLLRRETPEKLLLRCLLRESGQDMRDGLERPIGTRWVHYAVPRAIYDLPRPARARPASRPKLVQLVRYSLNTVSEHRPVLPPLADTLLVADKFRSAALALHRYPSRNLSGHEANGGLCMEHDHAFYWPTDEDNDGFIDKVTVYCPRGFEQSEVDALNRLVRIKQRGGRPDLLVSPVYAGSQDNFRLWSSKHENGCDRETPIFVSATPYFCPVHLSHGRGSYGRIRPITQEILKGMKLQGIITDDSEVRSIGEIVFDYAPEELQEIMAAISTGRISEPVPPRQFFPLVEPNPHFPPLAVPFGSSDGRFIGAFLKDPDCGFLFGLSIGLLVNNGTRFIRAMGFCRRRGEQHTKNYGRMFRIEFSTPRKPMPFAIGDQCHFGLGLFVPLQ